MAQFFSGRGQQAAPGKGRGNLTQVLPETTWADEPMSSGVPAQESVVVTIALQFGSGGAEVGRIVARECQLNYVDHEIIDEVAKQLNRNVQPTVQQDELAGSTIGRILTALSASNPFGVNYHPLFGSQQIPAQAQEMAYFHLTQKVLLEMATQGNVVIVGRGAQFLLHNNPRTLHIYIFAPLPSRIQNVMEHFHLDHVQAQVLLEQRDFEYSSYLRRYYGADGSQPNLYHLLINTGLFSYELAADLVGNALPLAKEIGS